LLSIAIWQITEPVRRRNYNVPMKLFVYECVSAGGLGAGAPASLRPEGWAMLAALVEDFDKVPGVETHTLLEDSCPRTLGRRCQRVGPAEEPVGFLDVVSRSDQVLVIAPETDHMLATRSRWVLEAGKVLLGPSLDATNLASDKLALARHWKRCGVPTPETEQLSPSNTPANFSAFPAVCKPRCGAGSQATFLVRDHNDLAAQAARAELPGAEFVLQPFVPGQPASVTFLCGPAQRLALLPATQNLSHDGRFRYRGGDWPLAAPLAKRAILLAERALATLDGLVGMVGVDLVLGDAPDGSADFAIEINPRPTTSYIGLRQLAEDNLAGLMLRIAQGECVPGVRWRTAQVRVTSGKN
jgi:predicted ATP-grasp superfamily ATP-dependent carboligase